MGLDVFVGVITIGVTLPHSSLEKPECNFKHVTLPSLPSVITSCNELVILPYSKKETVNHTQIKLICINTEQSLNLLGMKTISFQKPINFTNTICQ